MGTGLSTACTPATNTHQCPQDLASTADCATHRVPKALRASQAVNVKGGHAWSSPPGAPGASGRHGGAFPCHCRGWLSLEEGMTEDFHVPGMLIGTLQRCVF